MITPNNIPEHLRMAHDIKYALRLLEDNIMTGVNVVFGTGYDQCTIIKRDEFTGGGYCWSSRPSNTIYYAYDHRNPEDSDTFERNESIRLFTQEDYFYFHPSLTHFSVFRDSRNLNLDYVTVPLVDYDDLDDGVLFQYSTLLKEDELIKYKLASYLKHIGMESFTLRIKELPKTIELLLQEKQ